VDADEYYGIIVSYLTNIAEINTASNLIMFEAWRT